MNKALPRSCSLNQNEFNVGIEVWLLDNENNLLITQRNELKSPLLQCECPCDCCLAGDISIQTAIKEIQEEIERAISNSNLQYLDTYLYEY